MEAPYIGGYRYVIYERTKHNGFKRLEGKPAPIRIEEEDLCDGILRFGSALYE